MSRELNEIKKLAGLTQLNEYYIYADEEEDPIGKKINDIDRGEMDDLVKRSTAPDPENAKVPMPPMRPGPEPARSPEDKEIGKVLKNAPPGIKMRTIEQNVSASGPWGAKPAPKEVDNRPIPYNPQATAAPGAPAPAPAAPVDNRPIPFRPNADTSPIELPGGGTTPYAPSRPPPATAMTGEKDSNPFGKEGAGSRYAQESAKPDFLDVDKDGNKKEPMKKALKDKTNEASKPDYLDVDKDGDKDEAMKKALKDKERSDESLSWMRKLAGLQEALPVFAQPTPNAPKTIKKASAGTPAFADTPSATSSIITPSSVERAAAARQAASSNDDSSAIDAAVDAARDIDPEIVSKEKSWDEKSWDEMTPADKKKYHEVYPPEADQPTVAHSDSGGYHDPGFADRMAYIDSLAGKPEAPFELPPPPTPKLADYTFDQWRAANPDKPVPQGMVVPLVAPGTVLPPIGRIASPEEMLKMQNSPGYKPAEMPPYAVRKDYKPDADQIAESKGILDREQHIAWLQKILDSTNTK